MSAVNKVIWTLIIAIMFILGFGAWDIRQNNIKTIVSGQAHAGIFDDITTAITGHINDAKDRFKDDEFIIADKIKATAEFTLSKDSIHWAEGTAQIVTKDGQRFIQLNQDFRAGLAPDLYIFTSDKIIDSQSKLDVSKKSNLHKLKKGSGASYYKINNWTKVKSIVIWCKAFNQWMGTAVING